jgi:hypothetical protein
VLSSPSPLLRPQLPVSPPPPDFPGLRLYGWPCHTGAYWLGPRPSSFHHRSFPPCHPLRPRGARRVPLSSSSPSVTAFANRKQARRSLSHRPRWLPAVAGPGGSAFRGSIGSLSHTAWWIACLLDGPTGIAPSRRGFYTRACAQRVAPSRRRVSLRRGLDNLRRRVLPPLERRLIEPHLRPAASLLLASAPGSRPTPEVDFRAPLAACPGGTHTRRSIDPLQGTPLFELPAAPPEPHVGSPTCFPSRCISRIPSLNFCAPEVFA